MDNRRLLFATVLCALIWVVWMQIFPPPTPTPLAEPPAKSASPPEATSSEKAVPGAEPTKTETTAIGESTAPNAAGPNIATSTSPRLLDFGTQEPITEKAERSLVLENELVRLEFTNRGAQLKSAVLKKHQTNEGQALNLVQERGLDPYPFGVLTEGGRSHELNNALFLAETPTPSELRFRHQSGAGIAEKSFKLDEKGFLSTEIKIDGSSRWGVLFGPGLDDPPGDSSYGQTVIRSVGIRQNDEDTVLNAEDVEEEQVFSPVSTQWIALEDNFFFAAMIPGEGLDRLVVKPVWRRAVADPTKARFLAAPAKGEEELIEELLLVGQAEAGSMKLTSYYGAKQFTFLSGLPYGLEHTVRWGTLFIVAKPLYLTLEWIVANVVSNYGWAIVLVTFLIKLVFFPLTHRGQKAMVKMQELSPKIQAIRTKFQPKLRDKQGKPNFEAQRQMNDEVMALYRSAGVNPASGCLPMLLQMPVFFAFYTVLTLAVELRQAPWILWISNLSVPDPYYVLPVVMGATSVLLQRMSPAPPDQFQAKLLQLMPIMFTAFAFAFPSGLVVYWLTNNLLTMAQQAILMKQSSSSKK